jgi:hypothetical protein
MDAIRTLVSRHEALRTTFTVASGEFLSQHVSGRGMIPVTIYDAAPGKEEQAAVRLAGLLTDRQIDVTVEFPIRVGLITASGAVHRIVVAISRMVTDGWGFGNLLQDLLREVDTSQTGASHRNDDHPTSLFHQLDQWEWERSAHGMMRGKAALAYRMRLLEKCEAISDQRAARLAPVVGHMRRGELSLGAEFTASLKRISNSLSVSTSTVLLTSSALAVSKTLGVADLIFHLHCANRPAPDQGRSVTRLKSMSLMPYRQASDAFSAEAKTVSRSALVAYRHAMVPQSECVEIIRRAGYPFLVEFNDRRTLPGRSDRRTLPGKIKRDQLNDADIPDCATSKVDVTESTRRSIGPYIGFMVDPKVSLMGVSIKLVSNILRDEEIISTLASTRDSLQRLSVRP